MQAAYRSSLEKQATRFDLGLQNLSQDGGKDCQDEKALYWASIYDIVIEVGRASRGTLNRLLLLGESADDPEFLQTVQDALRALLPDATTQDISTMLLSGRQDGEIEPLYLAARGAAEFAKRAQEAPAGCKEPAHCAENRVAPFDIQSNQILLTEQ